MTKPLVPPYGPSLADWMRAVAAAVNYKTDIGTVTAPPARGDWSSINTAFTGDLGNPNAVFARSISGATTLGQPSTGYQNNPETAGSVSYLYNTSGWNQGTADNIGRTNCHSFWGKVDNYGLGDCSYITVSGFVQGARAGATNFLANPAISAINCAFTVGAHANYGNPFEVSIDLQAFDAAAIGYVSRITRNTGDTVNGLGAYTAGFRAQSEGTYPVDAMLSGAGPFKFGVDLVGASYPSAGVPSFSIAAIRTPSVTYAETAAASIPTPASGYQTLFIDTADHKLKRKDSSAAVTTIA